MISRLKKDKQMITAEDYANDRVLFANTPAKAESPPYSVEQAARGIGFYINANKR